MIVALSQKIAASFGGEALSTLRGDRRRLNEPTNTSDQRTSAPVGELMAFDQE
ncbi:MAG TPA: hypothetical protein VJ822_10480 [Dongiaceae bacterium]|nr:hypothetical protein [Dongiaceae bacterium]